MKTSEFQKRRWQTPLGILLSMQRIEEAFEYYQYDHNFCKIIEQILDNISQSKEEAKSVVKTIMANKDNEFFPEMIDAIVKMGDTFYKISASSYNSLCESEEPSDRKSLVICDELERHNFKVLYVMAKKYQDEKEL